MDPILLSKNIKVIDAGRFELEYLKSINYCFKRLYIYDDSKEYQNEELDEYISQYKAKNISRIKFEAFYGYSKER